ncbi:alpha/beta hydrolase [Roseibacillus ishigakijimensis]|uniref:Alpha/beta hydrolase n=1 Tax=Roseibacillus ishigakijimensis TaxID=454146 RepID=A0A934RT40_9BACT|nr:alpha/beta hydrolase [Roseibacillus ishigakijimensis]MBK1833700.1 alpha/beta hydrolase [Roseibacillus ishigakijimensis]
MKRSPRLAYWLYRAARLLVLAYGTVLLFAWVMGDRLLFQPPPASYRSGAEGLVRFGPGDEFAGIYLPPSQPEGPILLWSHGNAEDAGQVRELAPWLEERGLGAFFYDYPGYGLSRGRADEEGVYRSAEAAWLFLREKGHAEEEIVLLGQSLGSGAASFLAREKKAGGLILVSPFKSAFRVVTRRKIVPWDRFDNWAHLQGVEMPLLVIHGEEDEVVPFSHGEALVGRHEGRKRFLALPGVGHNDLWGQAGEEVLDALHEFVTRPES